jgi:hypothetical protein
MSETEALIRQGKEIDRLRAELARREPTPDAITGMPSYMQQVARAEKAEAAIAVALGHLNALFGYLDWYDATPAARLRAESVRAMALKTRRALDGGS